jgi:hypothetical protein
MTLGLGGGALLLMAAVGASAVCGRYFNRPKDLTAEKEDRYRQPGIRTQNLIAGHRIPVLPR